MENIFLLVLVLAFLYYNNKYIESFKEVKKLKKKKLKCETNVCPECPTCPEFHEFKEFTELTELTKSKSPSVECPKCEIPDEKTICKKYIEKKWDLPQWSYLDPKEIYKGHKRPPVCAMDKDTEGNVIIRKEPDAVLAQTTFTNYLEAHNNTGVGDYLPVKKLIRDNDFYNKYDECYKDKVRKHIKHENDNTEQYSDEPWENPEDEKYEFLVPKKTKKSKRKKNKKF